MNLHIAGLIFYSTYFMMASAWSELSITVRHTFEQMLYEVL
jgi:hypothetical protein